MDNTTRWDLTPAEAVAVQERLRDRVSLNDELDSTDTVAGVDVSIGRGWKEGRCAIVVLSFPALEVLETRTHTAPITFPYIPGLLAFREIPIFLQTLELLESSPDLFFFDGQGYAHPRRFGFACYAGLLIDRPAIGCAKSRLMGHYDEPGEQAGSVSPLIADEGDRIGDVLRTKTGVKPVFISPGHKISFDTATRLAMQCTRGHRIPEPTRLAHEVVSGLHAIDRCL